MQQNRLSSEVIIIFIALIFAENIAFADESVYLEQVEQVEQVDDSDDFEDDYYEDFGDIGSTDEISGFEDYDDSEEEEQKTVCSDLSGESDSWYDLTHTYLSIQFCEPAVWFDSFFSDERVDEEFRPGTRVRWQNDFIQTEGKGFDYVTRLNASFKLPKAKKSINVIFEGEEEDTLEDVVPDNEREVRGDLGLLYEIRETARANLSLRIKLKPSIKIRYRYRYPVTLTFNTRFTQELFRKKSDNGATTRIDFEKQLPDDLFIRQSNSVTIAENIDGKEWATSLELFKHLSDASAFSYESAVTGLTEPENYATNIRVGVRYRRNIFRKWLFYELAPALTWPRPFITDERRQVWEFLFRLEVNFINL